MTLPREWPRAVAEPSSELILTQPEGTEYAFTLSCDFGSRGIRGIGRQRPGGTEDICRRQRVYRRASLDVRSARGNFSGRCGPADNLVQRLVQWLGEETLHQHASFARSRARDHR